MSATPDQVTMTLPDGKAMTFTRGVTGAEIAQAIGPGLAKAALTGHPGKGLGENVKVDVSQRR